MFVYYNIVKEEWNTNDWKKINKKGPKIDVEALGR